MNSNPAHRIGFVSTRFAGTDGVSLEAAKWAVVLERLGHTCFWFAGQSNRPADRSRVIPEAAFSHKAIAEITGAVFGAATASPAFSDPETEKVESRGQHHQVRPRALTDRIHELKQHLKSQLYDFAREFDIDLLIVENALTIPLNIPLGLALTEFIAETGLPTIGHHHDFYRERMRFMVNSVSDYLNMAFPPALPTIRHVVINSVAAFYVSTRLGVSTTLIPNVMDFDHPPPPPDDYAADLRQSLGLASDVLLILQPTRIVHRKGIEHAIELTRRLGPKSTLVISHASGDEGHGYQARLREFADVLQAPVLFVSDIIQDQRGTMPDGRKIYTLWDAYAAADLVTYPSSLEGFGNAFLEAIYFRRPVVVNNYSIFEIDIKPKGFKVIDFDGFVTETTLERVHEVLSKPKLRDEMTELNYRIGKRHYSYSLLERQLTSLINDLFGEAHES